MPMSCSDPAMRDCLTTSPDATVIDVTVMGKYVTRRHRGDKELQERILAEANRLYETKIPLSNAIDRLVELADGNPNAFGLGGSSYRNMVQTPEGEAVARLMLGAELKRTRGSIVPANSWWPGGN
jgi:hypothetical protein